MWKLFLFLFLISCTSPNSKYNANNEIFKFDGELTFDEFNDLLIKYAETSPYPDIDQ